MPERAVASDAIKNKVEIHLLNVGDTAYGDCALCIFGDTTVLIDGGHPHDDQASDRIARSIPDQLSDLLGQPADSIHVNLLIVTHTHADHFGCFPDLVLGQRLTTDWALIADPELGWGHGPGGRTDAAIDPRVRRIMEFFRDDTTEDDSISDSVSVLSDAGPSQEEMYLQMVAALEKSAHTVRYRDNQPPLGAVTQQQLLKEFEQRGLKIEILGPTAEQLFRCADGISQSLGNVQKAAQDALAHNGTESHLTLDPFLPVVAGPVVTLGRTSDAVNMLSTLLSDASRKPSRAGNFVNLQSLTTVFHYADRKFLFSGDMQMVDPTTQFSTVPIAPEIHDSLTALRQAVAARAPYDFVKLGHHGSHNATDPDYFASLGDTVLFGISLGRFSPTHPSQEVLDNVLAPNRDRIQWLRTDFNGLSTFTFTKTGVTYQQESNKINDLRPNPGKRGAAAEDAAITPHRPQLATPAGSGAPGQGLHSSHAGIHLNTSIPFGLGEARISLSIIPPQAAIIPPQPAIASPQADIPAKAKLAPSTTKLPSVQQPKTGDPAPTVATPALTLAAGRPLPKLLFVTGQGKMSLNIGKDEAAHVLDTLARAGMVVISDLKPGLTLRDFAATSQRVKATLAADPGIRGVVLLGGMDVVPSQQVDTLPDDLRHDVQPGDDLYDNFVVWCDDEYGVRAPGSMVPVSRIPDGQYAPLVFGALSAARRDVKPKFFGIRNQMRPFVTQVSPAFPDDEAVFLVSGPASFDNPDYRLSGENLYIMLHGDFATGREYVGETENGQYLSAMRMDNVPDVAGHVVFAGCCWGALTTNVTASRAPVDSTVESKGHNGSIALRFLERGVLGFVGCTGAHYPPQKDDPTVNTLGGAMHTAFWKAYLSSPAIGPAEALLQAKADYLAHMPHGQTDSFRKAAEYKTYYQFTCLGLGW